MQSGQEGADEQVVDVACARVAAQLRPRVPSELREVLADVLSSQRGALYQLVPEGKALFTDFDFDLLAKAGMGYATAGFPSGGNAKALEQEVRAVLAKIARDGVPPDLVAAAKLQERRAAEAEKNSIQGLAGAWAEAVAVDGLSSPDEDLERIEKVTAEDVMPITRLIGENRGETP